MIYILFFFVKLVRMLGLLDFEGKRNIFDRVKDFLFRIILRGEFRVVGFCLGFIKVLLMFKGVGSAVV